MQEHLRQAHSEERPYKCEESECGKTFKLKQDLQTHLRTCTILIDILAETLTR